MHFVALFKQKITIHSYIYYYFMTAIINYYY